MLAINSLVAVYQKQSEAEAGLHDLQQDAFDLKKLSILSREHETGDQVIGYYSTGGHLRYWGARGGFWNGSWKLLSCAGCFVVPDLGVVLVAGPLTVWIVSTLNDASENRLSAVGAGFLHIGIPMADIFRYEAALKMHKLLLVAHGTPQELFKARDELHKSRPEEMSIHFADQNTKLAA